MKRQVLNLSIIILMMIFMSACQESGKMSDLLEHVPESAEFVAVGNVNNIVESIGGSTQESKIKLPRYITDLIDDTSDFDEFNEFNSFLKSSGIDIDACGIFFNYEEASHPVLVFSLTDRQQFIEAIEDEGYREKNESDDINYYTKRTYESSYDSDYDEYSYIAVSKEVGYWIDGVRMSSSFKPLKVLARIAEDLSEGSFAETPFGNYIKKGNALGIAAKIPKEGPFRDMGTSPIGSICINGSTSNDAIVFNVKCFDLDGKNVDSSILSVYCNVNAKINPDALKYFGKDECLVFATSIKDLNWDKLIDMIAQQGGISRSERSGLSVVTSYLEKIDGTIAVGVGTTDGLDSFFGLALGHKVLSQISATIVVEARKGKGQTLLNDLMGLIESQSIPYEETTNGFEVSLESEGTLYAKNIEDMIVFSTHPIKKDNNNEVVKSIDFDDHTSAMALVINRRNKLFDDLGISNDIKATLLSDVSDMESEFAIEVSGGKSEDGVMAKLTKMVVNIVKQEESLERKFRQYREKVYGYSYYDNDDDEPVVCDSCEVDTAAYDVYEWDE